MRHPVAAALAAAALALPLLAGVPFAIAEEAAASVASSASAADLSQESGSAASQPAESSASAQPQDAGESGEGGPAARAPFALASARVWVPYGVNVQDWLNSRDAGLYVDANGAELSAASVRDSFFGGRGPLVLDVSGGYPAQGSSLRAYLSWASNTTAKGDVPPDLGTIDVVMKTVNGADDLPLAPESIAGALKAATPNGTLGVTTVASGSGTGRTLRLWLGSDAAAALNEGSKVTISASDPNSTITFSRDYALDADGSFAASTAEPSTWWHRRRPARTSPSSRPTWTHGPAPPHPRRSSQARWYACPFPWTRRPPVCRSWASPMPRAPLSTSRRRR